MSGRPETKGRFATRAELEDKVKFLWTNTRCPVAIIARNCSVSSGTVDRILEKNKAYRGLKE